MANRHRQLAACAAVLAIAAPGTAARPVHREAPAALPRTDTVTVHRGVGDDAGAPFAETGAPWIADDAPDAPFGYWEANYGREDDAAIFARRYGCARPIWNAKFNRYMSACH